jgi:NRAMP (natural resistance-associated macrophage protein)-like metal ion transporter
VALEDFEPTHFVKKIFRNIGPGLITGVSDDDPSGIATYAQTGAQLGYGFLWTLLFSFPLMAAIQEICARIGCATGRGLVGNLNGRIPRALLGTVILALFIVNSLNIGADIQAMGESMHLLSGGPIWFHCLWLTTVSLILQVAVRYHVYVAWLKWLTVALFGYVAVVWMIHVPWGEVVYSTLLPNIHLGFDELKIFVAILGTTISPYMFFWQASEEVEELQLPDSQKVISRLLVSEGEFASFHCSRIKWDTYSGMAFSNLIAFFIMVAAAATLHAHGVLQIETAAQAAEALRPLAGKFCFALFSIGIIGAGLLAVPVLSGSASYAISEFFGWKIGLEEDFSNAKPFYLTIIGATVLGWSLTFLGVNPIQALVWTAILNGMLAPPLVALLIWIASRRDLMKGFALSKTLRSVAIFATIVMAVAAILLIITAFR